LFSNRERRAVERGDELKAKKTIIPRRSRYRPTLFPRAMRKIPERKQSAMIPEGDVANWQTDSSISIA
jgi:hypothetical protein